MTNDQVGWAIVIGFGLFALVFPIVVLWRART